ncbi:unnamed protein product [Trifolium pratense]|uniref:Uncharacterized protein n=1 Tax=Trifolium pratense TaxID=57577 RepID=A0ACB0LFP4_TRIPR|nr:unnamed protein product [Trifolium pratense]
MRRFSASFSSHQQQPCSIFSMLHFLLFSKFILPSSSFYFFFLYARLRTPSSLKIHSSIFKFLFFASSV